MKLTHLCFMVTCLVMTAVISACGGGGSNRDPVNQTTNNGPTITGIITAPDGETPIANASVFILSDSGNSANLSLNRRIRALTTTSCGAVANVSASTCTDARGEFSLRLPGEVAGVVPIGVRKGVFTASFTVDVTGLTAEDSTDSGILALPTDPINGAPRMAVVTGAYDRMQDILAKMGFAQLDPISNMLDESQPMGFDIYDSLGENPAWPLFWDLFLDGTDEDDLADIFNYDIVFINCGNFFETPIFLDLGLPPGIGGKSTIINTLRQYVADGGKIYVTDQAYDFVEQTFPEYIDFYSSDATPATEPEIFSAAEAGVANIEAFANINNNTLLAWLDAVTCGPLPCLNDDDTVTIKGFLSSWAVMDGVHAAKANEVNLWVEAQVSWLNVDDFTQQSGVRPLTVTFNSGLGTVLYSSYHTNDEELAPYLRPQERILQYLVFEL